MAFVSTDGWQPNGKRSGRNSGTRGSINDRTCCVPGCGRKSETQKQEGHNWPKDVWCATCGGRGGLYVHSSLRMRPTDEEKESINQAIRDGGTAGVAALSAQREAGITEMLEDNPRPARSQTKVRYDQLMENCSRRPEPSRFFYNPLGRALSALICACNCAINLVAARFPPVVYMFFLSLFGCTCAKKGDIVAIPKDYVVFAIAVYTLLHATRVVDPWAFVSYRLFHGKETSSEYVRLPLYDDQTNFDSKYDEEDRFDSMRVSLIAANKKDMLLPMSRYRPRDDFLGEITSESVGHASRMVLEIPCIFQGVETVVAVKCFRRQFVMAYLMFAFGLVGCCWSAAHVLDFEALKEGVAAATIDNIIESSWKGQDGVRLVGRFENIYMPIFEMLQTFLIEAFGGRLPDEDELAPILDSVRGKHRLGECQLQDGAVAGDRETAATSRMRGGLARLEQEIGTVLSPARVKEIKNAAQPGWRGKAWGSYYAVRDGASAALTYLRRGSKRRSVDDDDGPPSQRLRVGEGMPSAAEADNSCKEPEPQGSTNPRDGVRRNLLADITNHMAQNAVHQLPIG